MNGQNPSPPRARVSCDQSGLTLVELVVVAVLISILSAALFGALSGIIRTRDLADDLRKTDRTAHYLFGRLGQEIAGRSFVPLNTVDPDDDSGSSGTGGTGGTSPTGGVGGATGRGPSYLVGTDKREGEFDEDSLRFVSANSAQTFVGSAANFGTVEVEYYLEEPENTETNSERVRTLIREELPASVANAETLKKRRIRVPLADDIVSLNFRYLKGGKWQKAWQESSPPFPEMLEITIVIRGNNGRTETYRTAFAMSQKPRASAAQGQS